MKLDIKGFENAFKELKKHITKTPLIRNEYLSKKYSCNVFLKLENLQPVGSFKLRGATNMIANLSEEELKKGVVAVSAGNHAQGVAWAANIFGTNATIIMPENSPLVKIKNTEALGAKVILHGENVDESFEYAKKYLEKNNQVYVHPFNDINVIYGQGTIAYELLEDLKEIDFVFGSVGGGGLMSGVGYVMKHFLPQCSIIGSQSAGAASMIRSLQQGKLIEVETVKTFADGIKVKKPDLKMYSLLDELVDDAIQVDDDKVALAVLELLEQARVISEGAGAINLAALDELIHKNPRRLKGKNVVLLICGGNIDINLIDRIIDKGLMESGRRMNFRILLDDTPGALSLVTQKLTDSNANILHIDHKRDVPSIQINESIVELSVECKGKTHSEEILTMVKNNFNLIE